MTAFHQFSRLPPEIRTHIWSLSAHPRLVHVSSEDDWSWAVGKTSCPPVMHTCRESRKFAPYQQAFANATSSRYIWINFEVDMVCAPDHRITNGLIALHRKHIRRLRLTVGSDLSYDYLCYWPRKDIDAFNRLRELHLVVTEGILIWAFAYDCNHWGSCPPENIRFIEPISGLMLDGHQLSVTDDWHLHHSWDGGGRVSAGQDVDEEI